MLALRVRYLAGSVVAADIGSGNDKDRVEWPPHPDRLFSALVQAWGDLAQPEDGRAALLWLERMGAPVIVAPELGPGACRNRVTQFVPVNDVSVLARPRKERFFASAFVGDAEIEFRWPAEAPGQRLPALQRLAASVACLGHSSSLVHVSFLDLPQGVESPAEETLVPNPDGSLLLRVPHPGRFAHLTERYDAEPRRRQETAAWAAYARRRPENKVTGTCFADLIAYRLVGNVHLPLVATARVLHALRGSILAASPQPVPEVISGHDPDSNPSDPRPSARPHLALVPLPDVGHMHAGGRLLGVAVACPRGLSAAERADCFRAVGGAAKHELRIGGLGTWRLEAPRVERVGLLSETWCAPSSQWASVTPFVFGRYPRDPYGDEAAALVAESCRMVGLPVPEAVEIGPVSRVVGVPRASEFSPLPSRDGKPRRYHSHVWLHFGAPVSGPVLLGWGRYQGYGFFRPLVGI